MDRQIVYPGAIPLETDLLNTNKYAMIGLSKLAAAVLGVSTFLNGLACTPTGPASLQVYVAPGEIYSLQNIDGTAYSSISADTTHAILKQGISLDQLTLSCPAPATVGQSINYLIQVAYQDTDANATVLPYYNSSNPSLAYSGPANSGTAQNTVRKGVCAVSAKAGVSAATGSQTTPAPDAGYVGAFVVTVAYGQTQITAPNISTYAGAPFIPSNGLMVGGLQQEACTSAVAGGTADAISANFFPAITSTTLANGTVTLTVWPTAANATSTPTFTPNPGVVSPWTIVKGNSQALAPGDIAGTGHPITLQANYAANKWVLLNPATGVNAAASIQGSFKNLQASSTGLNANVSVTADEIAVENAANAYQTLRSVNLTIAGTSSGVANGLDTGTIAGATWYSVWVIWNGTTAAGLLSLSATAPTMPSGYTHKARVGWIRTDGTANKYPLSFKQYGRRVQYAIAAGSNLTSLPQMASGLVGSITTPTWISVATSSYVPPTASRINGVLAVGDLGGGMVAPNNSYGAYNSASNPPPCAANWSANASGNRLAFDFAIESANIYWASFNVAGQLYCSGWEDNL